MSAGEETLCHWNCLKDPRKRQGYYRILERPFICTSVLPFFKRTVNVSKANTYLPVTNRPILIINTIKNGTGFGSILALTPDVTSFKYLTAMIQNFLKTAVRVLWKRKGFSLLNILGLAVGIAASLMLFLIIRYELSYEDFNTNRNRIYRITTDRIWKSNNEVASHTTGIPTPMPDALRMDFPQLEKIGTLGPIGNAQIYVPGKGMEEERRFKESNGLFWADPEIFDIMSFQWVVGNASGLIEPNKVAIAESLAKKYFDNADAAIGRMVQMWSFRIPLQVTGVYKDLPGNTDIPLRFAASFATLKKIAAEMFNDDWDDVRGNAQCFVMAREGHQYASLQSQLDAFAKRKFKDNKDIYRQLRFQPLTSMHLDKNYDVYGSGGLSRKELWSLGLIGTFLLLVACINFINLTTAQSVNRAKEIGVRKVLGGNRSQLMRQFLQETALITLISLIVGCLLAWMSLPLLNNLMQKDLSLNFFRHPLIPVFLVLLGTIVTLLAGIYPAMILSGFKPMMAFKSKVAASSSSGISLRRGLVVFQFVIAQLLIIGTIVVVKQMNYFRSQPMGFDKDGVVLINLPSDSTLKTKYPALKAEMQRIPGVTNASLCMDAPANDWAWTTGFKYENDTEERKFVVACQFADTSYFGTFGIPLVTGRTPFASDTIREVVVNELFVKQLGLHSPQDIIGKRVQLNGWAAPAPVVGVIKDYNNKSLRDAMVPTVISTQYNAYEWLAVKIKRENMSSTLASVRKFFTGFYPTYMYDQFFFDERIERFYLNEAITAQLFKIFSFLAILISCLGLYGLVSFMAVQKTREVGIRKVLGASIGSIVYMFSREFTVLILVAFIIAAPVAYYFMNEWLSGFYYHTSIGAGIFILAIIGSTLIAWGTVGYKALKAALVSPVKSLKSE